MADEQSAPWERDTFNDPQPLPAGVRYFEFVRAARGVSADTSKFWAVRFVLSAKRPGGVAVRVWWGRIGTKGGSKTFDEYVTDEGAIQDAIVRADEKLREGYNEVKLIAWKPAFFEELTPGSDSIDSARKGWDRDADGWPLDANRMSTRPPDGRRREPVVAVSQESRPRGFQPSRLTRGVLQLPATRPPLWSDPGFRAASKPEPISKPKPAVISTVRDFDFED